MGLNILDIFGEYVFNDNIMKQRLPDNIYKNLKRSILENLPLDNDIAETVATVMKSWAMEKGATHFTHWFQPMTNITAGKHDSFLSKKLNGDISLEFSGKELTKGEPDASSFPNGGIRNTFEARGYTAWDCKSPAFVRNNSLYIPTAFCAYTGEALDAKTPLLRSMEIISQQAMRLLKIFGSKNTEYVTSTVGAEQEYFLIDRKMYDSRLDLKICGRTLFGSKPVKGQEMDDHYCGRIRLRVANFMNQLDEALWKLGVASKTKHNEVAPAQHELASIYSCANIACDNNQLIMEIMREVAKKNDLACLLHEKPFNGVNGSGKHNNWSLSTNTGQNLLEPGSTPYQNIRFLIFLCAIITAVDTHGDLFRISSATASNDLRLGGNEAPPTIVSIYLGQELTQILQNIANGNLNKDSEQNFLKLGVSTIPKVIRDNSDRNRTSPFAFTGNKFEFRMVGSAASVAFSSYVINTTVAQAMKEISNRLENCKNFDNEINQIITDTMNNHGKVIFNGNSYAEEWVQQAKERNLFNLTNTVDAIKEFNSKKNIELFENCKVLTQSEIKSRYQIMLENYIKTIQIESNTMIEMVNKQILPSCIKYIGKLAEANNNLKQSNVTNDSINNILLDLSTNIQNIYINLNKLIENSKNYPRHMDKLNLAIYYRDKVMTQMTELRKTVDYMENKVDKEDWPIPGYTNILYQI